MTGKHPFDGEGLTYNDRIRYWDDIADVYSGYQQGKMPETITRCLLDDGIIDTESNVLELGSGPGTYSLNLAPNVKSLTCVDTSPRMLERLKGSAEEMGLKNISYLNKDFKDLPKDRYDSVISSLCPGTGSLDSLRKMDSLSNGHCVYIMWTENHLDNLNSEIWRELGKDYSFEGRKSSKAVENLVSVTDKFKVMEFYDDIEFSIPQDKLELRLKRSFEALGVDTGEAIHVVLSSKCENGIFEGRWRNSIRVIVWNSTGAERC